MLLRRHLDARPAATAVSTSASTSPPPRATSCTPWPRARISQIYTDAPGSLSGNGLKIARPDGTYFFYAHLSPLAPGIAVGTPVTAGQLVGYVGHTGNAGGPHLHLEVHPGGGSAVNPYPIVKAIGAC